MKIGHPKDFWGGALFALIGAFFALVAKGLKLGETVLLPGYAMGTPARMGPAFFPFWLGMILLALGVIIMIAGYRHKDAGPDAAFPKYHWGPILWVLGAVVMFGLILKAVGMLLAGVLLVVVAGVGDPEGFRWKSSLILGVLLTIFCALVFVAGLKLPIPLCPDVESIQGAIKFCRG